MKKLEFDQDIFDKAYNQACGFESVVRRYLELAQEPPKPVIERVASALREVDLEWSYEKLAEAAIKAMRE